MARRAFACVGCALVTSLACRTPDSTSRADAESTTPSSAASEDPQARARREAERALSKLVGEKPATTGALLGNVRPGDLPAGFDPNALERHVNDQGAGYYLSVSASPTKIAYISVGPNRAIGGGAICCEVLRRKLPEIWGPGKEAGGITSPVEHSLERRMFWLDPEHGQRAHLELGHKVGGLEGGGCNLWFDEFVPLTLWIDARARSIVPLWALGHTRAELIASIGAITSATDTAVHWSRPGIGGGVGPTSLIAELDGARIKTVRAHVVTDKETYEGLVAHLTAQLGTPNAVSPNEHRWPKARVKLTWAHETVELIAAQE